MSSHYEDQERAANEFAKLSGLPFIYIYTGGGCDAIYGHASKYCIYITDDANVPAVNESHYVGVYSLENNDLMGECWAANRGELLELFSKFSTLDELVDTIIGDGFNGFANVGAL